MHVIKRPSRLEFYKKMRRTCCMCLSDRYRVILKSKLFLLFQASSLEWLQRKATLQLIDKQLPSPSAVSKIFAYVQIHFENKIYLNNLLWRSYYASMLTKHFFDFFPACSLLLQPARKENFQLFSNLLA